MQGEIIGKEAGEDFVQRALEVARQRHEGEGDAARDGAPPLHLVPPQQELVTRQDNLPVRAARRTPAPHVPPDMVAESLKQRCELTPDYSRFYLAPDAEFLVLLDADNFRLLEGLSQDERSLAFSLLSQALAADGLGFKAETAREPLEPLWEPSVPTDDPQFEEEEYKYYFLRLRSLPSGPSQLVMATPEELVAPSMYRPSQAETDLTLEILRECKRVVESAAARAHFALMGSLTVTLPRHAVQHLHELEFCAKGSARLPESLYDELKKNGWTVQSFYSQELVPANDKRRLLSRRAKQTVQELAQSYDRKSWHLLLVKNEHS